MRKAQDHAETTRDAAEAAAANAKIATPPDQRPALYVQFAGLANERAATTQRLLEAHIAAAKSAFKI